MNSPICPTCGCSIARLGIARAEATAYTHEGEELLFCCGGCLELFKDNPAGYLAEIAGWIVCPTCLAEKPKELTVSIEHEGSSVYFCRCPCCVTEFEKNPEPMLAKLQV